MNYSCMSIDTNDWNVKKNDIEDPLLHLNNEWHKKATLKANEKNSFISNDDCYNPLQKYAPTTANAIFRNTPDTSSVDHESRSTRRGRDRTKVDATSGKHGNIVDNPNKSKSVPPMKYRSISCEDARQAVNQSLDNVSSMQHLLERRRWIHCFTEIPLYLNIINYNIYKILFIMLLICIQVPQCCPVKLVWK